MFLREIISPGSFWRNNPAYWQVKNAKYFAKVQIGLEEGVCWCDSRKVDPFWCPVNYVLV